MQKALVAELRCGVIVFTSVLHTSLKPTNDARIICVFRRPSANRHRKKTGLKIVDD
jgi:hypothetical protein